MLENINILDRYDETPKNRGQMSIFLEEVKFTLQHLEKQKGISIDDKLTLSEWSWMLNDIYENYRNLVNDETLFSAMGLCQALGKRSAIDSMLDDEENDL
jgi:hypothetical protein